MNSSAPGEREDRGQEQRADSVVWEFPWERMFPFLDMFGRGYIAFLRTKGPADVTEQPFNSRGERGTQRTDNLASTFAVLHHRHQVPELPYNCFSDRMAVGTAL